MRRSEAGQVARYALVVAGYALAGGGVVVATEGVVAVTGWPWLAVLAVVAAGACAALALGLCWRCGAPGVAMLSGGGWVRLPGLRCRRRRGHRGAHAGRNEAGTDVTWRRRS